MAITDKDKAYLLSIKTADIDGELLMSMFGDTVSRVDGKMVTKPSKYKTNDTFTLEANEYFNKEKIVTNVGLFIVNKFLIEPDFKDVVGYINTPINKKVQSGIDDKLAKALLNDTITVAQFVKYLDNLQWLTFTFNSMVSGSFTMKTLKPSPSVMKLKNKLLDENKEKLDRGDVLTAVRIETQLKDAAKKELAGDPGMDLYDSGARGSFDNNYKAIALMKGPVFNPTTGEWDIIKSNFIEGIDKSEIPSYGNSIVTGAYPKAVGTQVSGYRSKQLAAALQSVVLDEIGSDCGTKGYIEILVTPWTAKDIIFTYIIEGNKLVLLDETNIGKYMNKKVKMRSPMFCVGDKLCRACAGVVSEKLGITNIGLVSTKVATTILNLNMKKFHNSTASIKQIDLDRLTL